MGHPIARDRRRQWGRDRNRQREAESQSKSIILDEWAHNTVNVSWTTKGRTATSTLCHTCFVSYTLSLSLCLFFFRRSAALCKTPAAADCIWLRGVEKRLPRATSAAELALFIVRCSGGFSTTCEAFSTATHYILQERTQRLWLRLSKCRWARCFCESVLKKKRLIEAQHSRRPDLHLNRVYEWSERVKEGECRAQQLIFIGFKAINL